MKYFLILFGALLISNNLHCQQPPIQQSKMKTILINSGIINEQNFCDPCMLSTGLYASIYLCTGSTIATACLMGAGISSVSCYCCASFEYMRSNYLSARIFREVEPKINKWLYGVPELNMTPSLEEIVVSSMNDLQLHRRNISHINIAPSEEIDGPINSSW